MRKFRHEDRPAITRAEAGRVARIAVDNPIAPIEPRDAPEHTLPAMRRRLADAVRTELEVRKRRAGVLTYDDLLTELDKVLQGDRGEEIARRLRERWKVVLVDEFQDTDPVQWSIMRRAFGTGTLVLIGDPKQAIYAFRGADVYAYLDARRTAAAHATLDVNRRSDQALIDAYDALFAGARLGHEGIVYRTVRAAREGRGHARPAAADPRRRARRRAVHGARLRRAAARSASTSPRTSPPTSSGCSPAARPSPPTWPCSCRPTATPRGSATRSTPPASPPSSTARAACSAPSRPRSGCGCSRRWSGRRRTCAPAPPR